MVDLPGRSAYQPEDRADRPEEGAQAGDSGWGSPVPAEYGSLHAMRSPDREASPDPSAPLGGGLLSAWARSAGLRRVPDPEPGPGPNGAGDNAGVGGGEPAYRGYAMGRPSEAAAPAAGPPAGGGRPSPGPSPQARPGQVEDAAPVQRPLRPLRSPDPQRQSRRPDEPTFSGAPLAGGPPAGEKPTVSAPFVGLDGQPLGTWTPVGDPEATAAIPAAVIDDGTGVVEDARSPRARPGMPLRPARRPGRVRSRVVIRHLDVSTVAKVSVMFYLMVLVVIVVASVILWEAANSFGTLPSIQKSVRTLFSLKSFQIHVTAVAEYTAAAGVVIAVVGTIANILLAMIYNLIADVVGGIRVELESFGRD